MMRLRKSILHVACLAALLGACGDKESSSSSATQAASTSPTPAEEPRPLRELVGDLFAPVTPPTDIDREKMLLGRTLFHDPKLSGDGTVSCATCHSMDHGGAEPRATSIGIRGQVGPINSPTVLNSVFNFVQFWDGRAADLREQAEGPITNPIEMGAEWPTLLETVRADQEYVQAFGSVYGESGITQENVIDAIVEYERALVTPSRFDKWLEGDDSALTEEEQQGLRAFVEIGCTTCHNGRNLGGGTYQRMGLVQNYFERRGGRITEADLGRYNVTKREDDRHMFKVPTLRNIELTAPYFHDGSEADLHGAVRTMAEIQLGREVDENGTKAIVAFLKSLTGELPADARVPKAGAEAEGKGEGAAAAEGAEESEGAAAPAEGEAPAAE